MEAIKGIDVSSNQRTINWTKAYDAGVRFAILRGTTKNNNPDTQLASNIKGCKEAGVLFAFYKYMYATTAEKAQEEAEKMIKVLGGYGIVPNKSVKIWADVEDKTLIALGTAALTNIVNTFKKAIVASGFGFGLYMGKSDYDNGKVDTKQFNDDIWIARYYAGAATFDLSKDPNDKYRPTVNAGKLWGWQYTSSGKVGGIDRNTDLDICYYGIEEVEVDSHYYDTPEFTLIDSLNKIGVYSSYSNRSKIAAVNGIENYSSTPEQNLKMLELLNDDKLIHA